MEQAEKRGTSQQERLLRLQQEINELKEELITAEQAVERAVIEKGILPELRSTINERLPSYDTALKISTAPGLAEVFDPAYEITTESKEKLHRLLSNMPGGSIGIAGPRGVGKTTLLGAFCGKASTTELKERPVLSVMTSAPVQYDAREFILHIFSSVCQRALELKNKDPIRDPRPPWDYMDESQKPPASFFLSVIGLKEAVGSILLGLLLAASGLLVSSLSNISSLSNLFLGLGLFLVMLGVVGGFLIWADQARQTRLKQRRATERDRDDLLVKRAYERLQEIRFQQSFTSGWSGSLKGTIAPITLEAKTDAAMTLAEKQLSLPEIMDRYRDFLALASKEYEIIIGIDELDKLESDETAQRFLNEIKALFGMERCFYLVSISENAMSSFERRGLPLRDVFDSSFDAIVYVDYLSFDRAQRLLRRRVIGVPVPFSHFCHCMAGGLPRDLIRTFRGLFEEHTQLKSDESDLSTLCSSLIRSDLKSKLRAVSVAAKDIMLEPEVDQLFGRIRKLESLLGPSDCFPGSCPASLESSRDLLATTSQEPGGQAEPAEVMAKREKIASLSTELGVYLYYCVTLLEFFGQQNFDMEILKAAENSGALDQLAGARQFLAICPSIAKSTIAEFRERHGMAIPRGVSTSPGTPASRSLSDPIGAA